MIYLFFLIMAINPDFTIGKRDEFDSIYTNSIAVQFGSTTQTLALNHPETINANSGTITLFSAIPAATSTEFILYNNQILPTDIVLLTAEGVTNPTKTSTTAALSTIDVGFCVISVTNPDAALATSNAPKVHFLVVHPY
jgi:hypothetical protein